MSATEAERAVVAASLAGWAERGVRDAAVDSAGWGVSVCGWEGGKVGEM